MALTRLLFDQDQDVDRLLSTRLSPFFTGGLQNKGTVSGFYPRMDITTKGVGGAN